MDTANWNWWDHAMPDGEYDPAIGALIEDALEDSVDFDVGIGTGCIGGVGCASGIGHVGFSPSAASDYAIDLYVMTKRAIDNQVTGEVFKRNKKTLEPLFNPEAQVSGIPGVGAGAFERAVDSGLFDTPDIAGVGIFGFLKKAWKKVKNTVSKVTPKFVKKAVSKVVNWEPVRWVGRKAKQFVTWVDKATQHPAFTAVLFGITQAIPGAQAAGYVFLAVQAARKLVAAAQSGDPNAMAMAGADMVMLANSAGGGNQLSRATLDMVEAVKKDGVAAADKVLAQFPVESLPPDVQKMVKDGKSALDEVKSRAQEVKQIATAAKDVATQAVKSAVKEAVQSVAKVFDLGALKKQYGSILEVPSLTRSKYAHLLRAA